ncbi:MAG: preprotein translocase subunit SecG [Candidatus Taylorbacteria bacterium RIFCSPHIGHO2_02_49_25]|uniref:Protein-export membrane protein SecG n=1 Tax=Candidatus Taylorbacteria bacterium RIFCSPHIGHO2_02_49_25 TaxID=1802305 RepID=A0A1G2MGC9_9BACT|nr:MAG: preprotein translocase subunit SecG [Candidatus Taylorbacteria bacterium RIFCSPHIGHO2_01_FULL_49_60]OHA22764.1 MAG: preprotein translocase subunit SecG [Candidatus Taylorbacteria bacterium RIFCSPHIGHO2_02_49_25]OHA35535.1 MAG: preprotein translocase subunit SecG [Candidatus Taylorbacteria bacterium RIFCSPLOWO2_02_50_13]OHA43014.1 MAG: preprotein translocase subunit SecG [Candidatus Taylorbacteria bacterium RIFCSPLOWO2_02_FULL_50_120]OHA45775.1 MAG: preprotein translocase subunit SecG [C
MQTFLSVLPYIQIGLSVLLIGAILLQQSAAGLGGAFGDNFSSGFHTKRGFEKTLFTTTIVIAVLFAVSAITVLLAR